MVFQESGLVFSFPRGWGVRHYDRHTYYRGLSGQGLKAVDFMALAPDGSLWLIEVKNFRRRREFLPVLKTPAELGAQLLQKTADTQRAIHAIYGYYRRSGLYRWIEPLLLQLPWMRFDRIFWTRAYARRAQTKVVLWLELEPDQEGFRAEMNAWLKAHWPPDAPPVQLGGGGGRAPWALGRN